MEDDELTRLVAAACDRRRRSQVPGDGARWSKLPKDILSKVICHLPLLDDNLRLRLAVVCRRWHDVERLHLPYSLPKICLALPDGSFFSFQPGSPTVMTQRDDVSHGHCRGATSSQLLTDTEDRNVYSLVNPFNLRKRQLPVPFGIRVHEEDEPAPEELYWSQPVPVRKLVVCPDGLVAAIVGPKRSARRVALCKPEAARTWFVSELDAWRWYADMVYFDGKLYVLTNNGDLFAMEIGNDDEGGQPRISRVERVIDGAKCRYVLHEFTRMRYLIIRPQGQGLLMVCRIMLEHGSTTYEFAVFQADLPSSRWVQVDALGGDEALFVSQPCSRAVLADRHWVLSNSIYFLNDSAGDALASVYNMKDGKVRNLGPNALQQRGYSRLTWEIDMPATWLFSEDLDMEDLS